MKSTLATLVPGDQRRLWRVVLAAGTLLALAGSVGAGEAPRPWTLPELFHHIPPLKHDGQGRLPVICMEVFRLAADDRSFAAAKPLPADTIRELVRRGLTQWIPAQTNYIPYAAALQANGAKVVLFEGNAFNGPPEEEVPGGAGLHQLPPDYKPEPGRPGQQLRYSCPLLFQGWQRRADKLRATYRAFHDAGIHVDAAWYDWECEPYPGESQWREAQACSRCRATFPAGVLAEFARYREFITRLRTEVYSAYLAAPILEVYPQCSVLNWEFVLSSAAHPTLRWSGAARVPPTGIGLFTAANPVAYGNTAWYKLNWKPEWHWPLDVAHMDRLYTQVMLGQISGNAENEPSLGPDKQCVPWVDRVCLDDPDPTIPLLSRARYREILRHCWLRGADAMQVFNPLGPANRVDRAEIVNAEIADAVAVADDVLAYRRLLEAGIVMNTAVPAATEDGPIWSGLRLGDEAVVRVFTQAAHPMPVILTPFPGGPTVTLQAPPAGATYRLRRHGAAGAPGIDAVLVATGDQPW